MPTPPGKTDEPSVAPPERGDVLTFQDLLRVIEERRSDDQIPRLIEELQQNKGASYENVLLHLRVADALTRERDPQELDGPAAQEIEQIIARLDTGIAEERKAMDALLSRLRTTRIAA